MGRRTGPFTLEPIADPSTSETGPAASTPAMSGPTSEPTGGPFVLEPVDGLPGVYRQVPADT